LLGRPKSVASNKVMKISIPLTAVIMSAKAKKLILESKVLIRSLMM
jgi:hypothetical protein